MRKYLAAGDVPAAVTDAIEEMAGSKLVTERVATLPRRLNTQILVIHVPSEIDSSVAQEISDWLDVAEEEGVRVGLTSASGMSASIAPFLFARAVHPVMLLNDGAAANRAAVAEFVNVAHGDEGGSEDAVPIGRFFAPTTDTAAYRQQRFISLASVTMQPFLEGLQEAVHAMSQAPAVGGLRELPPWDPDGPLTSATKLGQRPSLVDLFRLNDTPEAARFLARDTAPWSVPKLLVRGESGSGKTLVAELVHSLIQSAVSGGAPIPFGTVNCAALTNANLFHELFGSAGGVWSGIEHPVAGDLARAGHGVAFLDEIGDLDPAVQRAMLVFLEDGMIRPFQIAPYPGFVRIVAATNRDVPLLIEKQQFRNDLNQRFSLQIEIPPLRDRGADEIEKLVDFVAINPHVNPSLRVSHLGADAMSALLAHEYRNGNFRELESVVHAGIGRARRRRSSVLRARDLAFTDVQTTSDREAFLVDVDKAPNGPYLDVAREVDLARVAAMASLPVLQTRSEGRYVVTREAVFRFRS